MSDNLTATAIGIVAIITALGSVFALLFKHIRKSDCMGLHIETRTPQLGTPQQSEIFHNHHNAHNTHNHNNHISNDSNNSNDSNDSNKMENKKITEKITDETFV